MTRTMRAAALAALSVGAAGGVGCVANDRPGIQNRYNGYVDPSWPERYSYEARTSVLDTFGKHVHNGDVLDKTFFNYHFEPGTDKLNGGGQAKVDYLARRRPAAPTCVYLQTARDGVYDPTAPDKFIAARSELDDKRKAAIQRYLATSTAGRIHPVVFDVAVIDPEDKAINAEGPAASARSYPTRFGGGLGGGVGGANTPGAAPGAAPSGSGLGGTPNPGGSPSASNPPIQ